MTKAMKARLTLFILFIAALLSGCRSVQIAASHSERDTIRIVDKEFILDSVFIDRWHTISMKGDTVFVLDSVTHWKTRERTKTDTLWKVSETTDTLTQTVTRSGEVGGYYKFTAWAFPILAMIVVLVIIFRILVFLKKI